MNFRRKILGNADNEIQIRYDITDMAQIVQTVTGPGTYNSAGSWNYLSADHNL